MEISTILKTTNRVTNKALRPPPSRRKKKARRCADLYELAKRPQGGNTASRLRHDLDNMRHEQHVHSEQKRACAGKWQGELAPKIETTCNIIQQFLTENRLDDAEALANAQDAELAGWIRENTVDSAVVGGLQNAAQNRLYGVRTLINKARSDARIDALTVDLRTMAEASRVSQKDLSNQMASMTRTLEEERDKNTALNKQLEDTMHRMEANEKLRVYEKQMKTTVRQPPQGSKTTSWNRPRLPKPGAQAWVFAGALLRIVDNEKLVAAALDKEIKRVDIARAIAGCSDFDDGRFPALHALFKNHAAGLEKSSADESTVPAALTREIYAKLLVLADSARRLTQDRGTQIQGVRDFLEEQLKPTLATILARTLKD